MNKETLTHLPALIQLMDENLTININNFINNVLLQDLKLHQGKLIEVIKSSNKFNYDNKTGNIKFNEKADRNILIIDNFINTESNDYSVKTEYLKTIINEYNRNYANRIKKIDNVRNGLHVVFDHEDLSSKIERYLIEVYLEQQINTSNFNDLKAANIYLAAESLKRRIISNMDQNFKSNISQVNYVNSILLNPVNYIPRRFTTTDNVKHEYKKISSFGSKPSFISINNHIPRKTWNNFSEQINANMPTNNLYNISQTIQNTQAARTSKAFLNKYDLIDNNLILPITRHKAATLVNKKHSLDFPNSFFERKISYNPNIPNKINDVLLKENHSQNIRKANQAEHFYDEKEILSVYFHMKFLKQFDFPQDLKDNFISSVMTEKMRSGLESFKTKKVDNVARARSKTLISSTKPNRITRNLSFSSNLRMSKMFNYYRKISLIENISNKRNSSLE